MTNSEKAERLIELLQRDTLTQAEVSEIQVLGRLRGELPACDGWDRRGKPFWYPATIGRWSETAVRCRHKVVSHGLDRTSKRRGGLAPTTWDAATRTFEVTIATSNPVEIVHFEYGYCREILVPDGCEAEETTPLQLDHNRTTSAMVGSLTDVHRVGDTVEASARLASNEAADEAAELIDGGHLRTVSVGYVALEQESIPPGGSAVIGGREYFNEFEETLLITSRWQLMEVSLVPVPADPGARIRSHHKESKMVAIQSRQSVTGRMTTREAAASILMRSGVSDPSRHLFASGHNGRQRIEPHEAERVCDIASQYRGISNASLFAQLLERDGARIFGYSPYELARAAANMFQEKTFQQRSVAGTAIVQAFDSVAASYVSIGADYAGDTAAAWTDADDLPNLMQWPVLTLGGGELSEVAKGGIAEQLTIDIRGETAIMARYGASVIINEEDLVNFLSGSQPSLLPRLVFEGFGRAAKSLELDLVYATLLSNPVMADGLNLFDEDHGNIVEGTLDETSLDEASAALSKQTRAGSRLNLRTDVILTPSELDREARRLTRLIELANERSTPAPAVVGESRLSLGVTHPKTKAELAGDDATYYVVSNVPGLGLQRQYLAGTNRQPKLRTLPLKPGSGMFGMGFDVAHFVGCSAIGWEGIVRVQPAAST